jgi:hypothetical protein
VYALGRLAQGEEEPDIEPIRDKLTRIRERDASAYVRDVAREVLVALRQAHHEAQDTALEGEGAIEEVPAPVPEIL